METRKPSKRSADSGPGIFRAPTLKEAYRRVKRELGDDAIILGSRKVTQRQSHGLGQEQMVEVMASPSGLGSGRLSWPENETARENTGPIPTSSELCAELTRDVERLEELVKSIEAEFQERQDSSARLADNPLAESLMAAGVQSGTMEKLLTRFSSETGKDAGDRVAALHWLTEGLRASNCQWDGFYGCHAFLGRPGCGRTSLVLQAAARLRNQGRRTLVLMVMPENKNDVRRLQTAASKLGFDGAIIESPNQLTRSEEHLNRYEAVLVDMPGFGTEGMGVGQTLHAWLSRNSGFHRHLVVPLESDPREMAGWDALARDWQADWLAASRCDMSEMPGKLLEFQDRLPLPYSLIGRKDGGRVEVEIASSEELVDHILGTDGAVREARA